MNQDIITPKLMLLREVLFFLKFISEKKKEEIREIDYYEETNQTPL